MDGARHDHHGALSEQISESHSHDWQFSHQSTQQLVLVALLEVICTHHEKMIAHKDRNVHRWKCALGRLATCCCCLFQCDMERQLLSVACWLRAYTLHHLLGTVCDPYYTK